MTKNVKDEGFATQKNLRTPTKKSQKKSQKITNNPKITKNLKNLFKFNMEEIVKIKKSSKYQNLQNFGEKIKKSSYTQGPSCLGVQCRAV